MTARDVLALWHRAYPGRGGADLAKLTRAYVAKVDALEALIAQQRDEIASLRARVAELQGAP
jgi:cell division protein FtsB